MPVGLEGFQDQAGTDGIAVHYRAYRDFVQGRFLLAVVERGGTLGLASVGRFESFAGGRGAFGCQPGHKRSPGRRGRLVLCGLCALAGAGKIVLAFDGRDDAVLYLLRYGCSLGRAEGNLHEKQKNPLSSFLGPCGIAAAKVKEKLSAAKMLPAHRNLDGSYTVEAAVVMWVVVVALWTTVQRAYLLHDQVAGSMILHEAVELSAHQEEPDLSQTGQAGEEAINRLFTFSGSSLELKQHGDYIEGKAANGKWSRQISVKKFQPQDFLRKITLLEELGDRDGSSV